jgi:hypothetical protein
MFEHALDDSYSQGDTRGPETSVAVARSSAREYHRHRGDPLGEAGFGFDTTIELWLH